MNKHQCPVGYVQVTDTRTIQKLILKLMVQFHEICEKHHFTYNLCGGTLLGAVRHKGFIPWDDDMDVCMPRNDYEKFVKIAKEEYADKFDTIAAGDDGCIYPYAKICMKNTVVYQSGTRDKYSGGVWLDIFPLDGYPGEVVSQQEGIRRRLSWIGKKLSYSFASIADLAVSPVWWKKIFVIAKPFLCLWFRMFGPEKFVAEYTKIVTKYKFEDCDEVLYWWVFYEKNRIPKERFSDRVLYDFEGYKFWSVKDYDDWLTRIYGDYMTPPPPEKRVQYHGFELFVKKEILESL